MPIGSGIAELAIGCLKEAEEICTAVGFLEAKKTVSFTRTRINAEGSGQDFSSLPVDLTHVREALMNELRKRKILYVIPSRSEYIGNPHLLGEAVSIALRALDTAAESDTSTGGVDRSGKIYPLIKIVSREGITTLPESRIAAVFKETVA